MALKGHTLKPIEERREIVREALKIIREHPGAKYSTIKELAEAHGVSRQSIYSKLDWVIDDPEGRVRQAEEELEFRREVLRLVS